MHIDLNVAMKKRENFDATDRETIFAQDIDFFNVAIDKDSDAISKKNVTNDMIINFDETKDEKMIDRNDETKKVNDIDCCETNFDFFA